MLSITLAVVFTCSLAFGMPSKRFDFGIWHTPDFKEGKCKLRKQDYNDKNTTVWLCQFKDGCLVGWLSDLSGANARDFRWLIYNEHGKVM